jgi:hypothetical protein
MDVRTIGQLAHNIILSGFHMTQIRYRHLPAGLHES